MKRILIVSCLSVGLAAALFGTPVAVTNELLTVDQNNVPSVTNVLGTVSDLAKLQAQTEINAAAAVVAEGVYDQATNLLDEVAKEITAEKVTVYRRYFLDSFTAVVVIDPAVDKVSIYDWVRLPDAEQTESGRVKWYMYFGCTTDMSTIMPQVKVANTLSGGTAGFTFLDAQYVTGYVPITGTYSDGDGNTFSHLYRVTVSIPQESSHFCILYVDCSAAGGSGDTLTAVGGFTGGITGVYTNGNLETTYTGGLVTGARTIP